MSNYDAWLERPYMERAAQEDAIIAYAEQFDLDPDEVDIEDVREYYDDLANDRACDLAEERRMMDEIDYDRDYDGSY